MNNHAAHVRDTKIRESVAARSVAAVIATDGLSDEVRTGLIRAILAACGVI